MFLKLKLEEGNVINERAIFEKKLSEDLVKQLKPKADQFDGVKVKLDAALKRLNELNDVIDLYKSRPHVSLDFKSNDVLEIQIENLTKDKQLLESKVVELKNVLVFHGEQKTSLMEKIKRLELDKQLRMEQAADFVSLYKKMNEWFVFSEFICLRRLLFASQYFPQDEKIPQVGVRDENSILGLADLPHVNLDDFQKSLQEERQQLHLILQQSSSFREEIASLKIVFFLVSFELISQLLKMRPVLMTSVNLLLL